jgi:lipoprotein-anchoring transpeptidase ErfK/SrfK
MGDGNGTENAGWAAVPPGLRLVFATLVLGLAWSGTALAAPRLPPTQALVTLLATQTAHAAPSASSAGLASIAARRPITGVRTVLPVLARTAGGWLRVRLPGRPNGRTGWITTRSTKASVTSWRIVVDRARRQVQILLGGRMIKIFPAVVGKPSTPTPTGEFFVEEPVRLGPGDVGAPYALALSARSNVLQQFEGGPGQVALHGLANVGGVLGTAVSHGCVRLTGAAMTWLVGRIGAGIPVTIRD